METKNVLVVVGVAVVLSVIVSLAVVGNLKGTGYAVGDTTKVRVAEGKNGTFSLGGVKHTISVSFADAKTGRVNFSIDNTLTKSTSVGGSVNYVGVESIYGQNFEATVDKITSFFGRDYVYFTVKEIPVNASQPVSSEEVTYQGVLDMLNKCTLYSMKSPYESRDVSGNEICAERNAGTCIFTVPYENLNSAVNIPNSFLSGSNVGIIQPCSYDPFNATSTIAMCC